MVSGIMIGVFLLAAALRILPMRRGGGSVGVDHWYWLAYTKALRQGQRLPPDLPNYLLDQGQWYPPLFPALLARLPRTFLEHSSRSIAIATDLARLALLLAALHWRGLGRPGPLLVAGLLYSTTPIVVSYNTQLNPRGLGALLMDGLMVLLYAQAAQPLAPWVWGISLLLIALILLTHKMTTQILAFVLLCLGLCTRRWEYLVLIPGGMATATLISGGFYLKVLKAHADITCFWSREWPLLGADPLRESPIYGKPGYQAPLRQYRPGLVNALKRTASLFLGNYAPAAAGALLLVPVFYRTTGVHFLDVWLVASLAFAALTVLVPWLRGFGFGNLYLYNAIFPASLLVAEGSARIQPALGAALVAVLVVLNLVALLRSFRHMTKEAPLLPAEVVAEIQRCGPGTWLCFPLQLMEPLAFLADRPVLWGAHGYGFKQVGELFPVIRKDFAYFQKTYGLRYLLVSPAYLEDVLALPLHLKRLAERSGFHLFELSEAS